MANPTTPTTAADKAANAEGVVAWPDRPANAFAPTNGDDCFHYPAYAFAHLNYERARAEAALARLMVAVEALERYRHVGFGIGLTMASHYYAAQALDAIGPLPTDGAA